MAVAKTKATSYQCMDDTAQYTGRSADVCIALQELLTGADTIGGGDIP